MNATAGSQQRKSINLVYLIGTYPELTNTFIDREITTLRQMGDFRIQIVSIRHPRTAGSFSPEQKALYQETLYLTSPRWSSFNFLAFFAANLRFVFLNPLVYFGTLFYLLGQAGKGLKAWLKTVLYFFQGVLAAYLLRRTNFDHIHVHFMDRAVLAALVASRLLKKTYSFTAHAADIYTKATHVRAKIENAQFVITVSEYNRQHLLDSNPGIDAKKIHVLHPWVDVNQFTPCPERPAHARLNILSVGRLVEKKGHLDLIEACQLLQERGIDAECWIAGEGPLRPALEARIAESGLQERVRLLGGLPQGQVMSLLKEWADVFALPCVIAANGDRDGIPVSIAEAMAMELPVVSSDIVGIRELVQPGAGFLVPPRNSVALADALAALARQNHAARVEIGRAGRSVVTREFNLQQGTRVLAGLFFQVIGERKALQGGGK